MKLFQHSSGFVVSFGFDMVERRRSRNMICWSDPNNGEWESKPSTLAGTLLLSFDISPEFIIEHDRMIIAYQPGKCIQMQYIGGVYVWNVSVLQAYQPNALVEAA